MNKNFNFKSRITLIALLIFLILSLAACFPVSEYSTSESSPTPSLTPSRAATTPAPTEALESGTAGESEEILLIPTLAPTATPGVIYDVVNQVVDATNLVPNALPEFIGCRLD